jgi:hypothetical protein
MKAKEAEARSFERTPRAGAHQVVRKLRGTADVAKHWRGWLPRSAEAKLLASPSGKTSGVR